MRPQAGDAKLFTRLRAGDAAAFAELYDAHAPRVFALALRMLGDRAEAEDVTQDTFLQATRAVGRFEGRSALSTWILAIAKHRCYRLARTHRTRRATLAALLDAEGGRPVPEELTPAQRDVLVEQVKEGCLAGVLRSLTAGQRTAFILHVLLRLSVREVAAVLGRSEGATKVLVHRARRELKAFLCNRCSRYDAANPCRCEGLIQFSLKQGWVSPERPADRRAPTREQLESEIQDLKQLVQLYASLGEPPPPAALRSRLLSPRP